MKKSNYSLGEIIVNVINLIRTKIYIPSARLVRFPVIIRGKKYIDFGHRLTTGYHCRFEVNGKHCRSVIQLGDGVNMGDNVRISAAERIVIGNNVLMGSKVLIIDTSHGDYSGEHQDSPLIPPNQRPLITKQIIIEDNVWIGEGVVVQPGVRIGMGSIIGANAVVTHDVEENCIVAGAPAKIVKKWNSEEKKWKRI